MDASSTVSFEKPDKKIKETGEDIKTDSQNRNVKESAIASSPTKESKLETKADALSKTHSPTASLGGTNSKTESKRGIHSSSTENSVTSEPTKWPTKTLPSTREETPKKQLQTNVVSSSDIKSNSLTGESSSAKTSIGSEPASLSEQAITPEKQTVEPPSYLTEQFKKLEGMTTANDVLAHPSPPKNVSSKTTSIIEPAGSLHSQTPIQPIVEKNLSFETSKNDTIILPIDPDPKRRYFPKNKQNEGATPTSLAVVSKHAAEKSLTAEQPTKPMPLERKSAEETQPSSLISAHTSSQFPVFSPSSSLLTTSVSVATQTAAPYPVSKHVATPALASKRPVVVGLATASVGVPAVKAESSSSSSISTGINSLAVTAKTAAPKTTGTVKLDSEQASGAKSYGRKKTAAKKRDQTAKPTRKSKRIAAREKTAARKLKAKGRGKRKATTGVRARRRIRRATIATSRRRKRFSRVTTRYRKLSPRLVSTRRRRKQSPGSPSKMTAASKRKLTATQKVTCVKCGDRFHLIPTKRARMGKGKKQVKRSQPVANREKRQRTKSGSRSRPRSRSPVNKPTRSRLRSVSKSHTVQSQSRSRSTSASSRTSESSNPRSPARPRVVENQSKSPDMRRTTRRSNKNNSPSTSVGYEASEESSN